MPPAEIPLHLKDFYGDDAAYTSSVYRRVVKVSHCNSLKYINDAETRTRGPITATDVKHEKSVDDLI